MPNTSTIAFALIVGYIVFITVRGELPVYLGVIGFGPDKNNTCANTNPTGGSGGTNTGSAPISVSNPTTINILQNGGQIPSPVIVNTTVNAPPNQSGSNPGSSTSISYIPGECEYDSSGVCQPVNTGSGSDPVNTDPYGPQFPPPGDDDGGDGF